MNSKVLTSARLMIWINCNIRKKQWSRLLLYPYTHTRIYKWSGPKCSCKKNKQLLVLDRHHQWGWMEVDRWYFGSGSFFRLCFIQFPRPRPVRRLVQRHRWVPPPFLWCWWISIWKNVFCCIWPQMQEECKQQMVGPLGVLVEKVILGCTSIASAKWQHKRTGW